MEAATTLPWTLRFTEWECGHHQQRPDDISCASVEQAKAICWAIACAINQPGRARAILFNDRQGITNIFMTDDYLSAGHAEGFDPDAHRPLDRPEVVLCADDAMAAAIMAPELAAARDSLIRPYLDGATLWDGKEEVQALQTVLTTMAQDDVEMLVKVDNWTDKPSPFELPPLFHDGAKVLADLQKEAKSIADYEAEVAREQQEAYDRDQAADLKREEQKLEGGAA